jgi:hypothetical protein
MRRRSRSTGPFWIRLLRLAAVGALIAAGVVARVATGNVSTQTAPGGSGLHAIACPSESWCVSVGSMGSVYGVQVPFAVLSTGSGWKAQPTPVPSQAGDSILSAVDCPSSRSCTAVGSQEVPTPFFGARSAGARPLAEHWDGTSWRSQLGPIPESATDAEFHGVSCVASSCMAVGEYQTRMTPERTLAESWDGRQWTLHLPPNPTTEDVEEVVLEDVACVSANDCTAVGHFSYEVALLGEAAAPLIERWNGKAWRLERAENRQAFGDTELQAVACASVGRCMTVGFQVRPNGSYGTLAEIPDGSTWKILPTQDPPGSPGAELSDVACPLPDRCIAVGSSVSPSGSTTLAESWDGTRWTIEPTPSPPGSTSNALTAIDCPHWDVCYASGIYWNGSPIGRAFSAMWNGVAWTILPVPGSV